MKKRVVPKRIGLAFTILTLAVGIIGCGSKADSNSSNSNNDKSKIVVATGGSPKPFTYVNDKNELVGYDIEVVNAVFNKLPQYEVSFEKTEFTSILTGLDSDRYQVGANNFAMNKERKEKYSYTDPIFKNQYVIAVAKNNNSIKSFKDLLGKTSEVSAGNNYTTALENFNKDNQGNPVKLSYTEVDLLPILQHVEGGQYDFQLIDKSMLNQYIDEYGLNLNVIDLSEEDSNKIATPFSYLLVSKGNEKLTNDINKAIAEIIKDGTVSQISKKYFNNGDYAPDKK
ncbi:transporter substrate-binding domain-containing protein [Clostridium sp. LP20]|uniref:transporter substrate-binding domain-containing protein n=1 Tax=Clostridium sp. LP20 TaxID=3418665 RepID=UPI003EE5C81E